MADAKVKHPRFVELHLGLLPVEEINATLQLELEAGIVVFSAAAQKHVYKRHQQDFQDFLAYAGMVVSSPGYIGQAPKHADKIELVKRLPPSKGAAGLLVALVLEPDASGRYHVASFYTVSEAKISNRRQSGTLKVPRKK